MTKKITSILLCLICALSLLSGCKKEEGNVDPLPVAESNPNITNHEGMFFESGYLLYAQGGLSVLGTDFLKLMIEGKEREFVISPDVQRKIDVFNKDKDNLLIKQGTILQLTYEKKDLVFVATDIEIINAN